MFERLEQYVVPLVIAGAGLFAVGLIWLIRRGFGQGFGWGIAALIPPFQLLFWWKRPRAATAPWLLMLLGVGLAAGIVGAVQIVNRIDLGERERMVDGQRHLTLTDWDKDDYSFLPRKADTAVLQMANKDVDDAVVAHLAGFGNLEELNLNDTSITDASLEVLAGLPKLRVLKIARTGITDAGFRKHLMGSETLMDLTVTGTKVTPATLKEWKKANKLRKTIPKVF